MAGGGVRVSGQFSGTGGRARITVRPGARPVRGRTPFVLLVVLLLSGGLLGLLTLNTALSEGSFRLGKLKRQTTELTDQEQTLQQQIARLSAPDALDRQARDLGMVPGGDPGFLQDDGKVVGRPGQAQDSPPVKRSGNDPWPSARPNAQPGGQPAPQPPPSAAPTGDPGVEIAPLPAANQPAPAPSVGGAR